MESVKKNDFVEIEYTGRLAEGPIFDTSDEGTAKKNGIFSQGMKYGPVTICVGQQHVIAGLDKNIEGKEIGKSYTIYISAEDGFGKKDAKLIKLVPASIFKKQEINPMPGLQVDIDGVVGTIRTATGGRVIVDFNHPFSGRDLIYDVKIISIVTDKVRQIKAILKMLVNLDPNVILGEGAATLELDTDVPKELQAEITKKIQELVKIDNIVYKKRENKKQQPAAN
jgi:FKBP-type peptidyl-prolyl cis-trans isomerase 2